MAQTSAQQDTVDSLIDAAQRAWPVLDPSPMAIVNRLSRVAATAASDTEAVAGDFGCSAATLEALVALRLAPDGQRLSQRALGDLLRRTSGTLSVRLARIEQAGLIARELDPYDARGINVILTDAGRALVDAAISARLEAERGLLAALDASEQEQLAGLLRKLLISLEARDARPRLGIEIAPRRAARQVRIAQGLAEGVGLLVAAVDAGSLAERAGISPADLIVRLDGVQLRSAAQLRRAMTMLDAGDELRLTVLRVGQERQVTVAHGT